MTDPLDLLDARQYDEAIEAYRNLLASDPENYVAVDGLATSLFAAGEYRESIPLQLRMDAREHSKLPRHCGRSRKVSIAHWCLGEREEAIRLMHAQCAGILDRSITYAPDHGGGSTMGVLLHYMAVSMGDMAEVAYAIKYLEKLNAMYDKRPFDTPYPSHLVKFILGLIDLPALLEGAVETNDLDRATTMATVPDGLLKRRYLCESLFHAGVMCRKASDEAGAKAWFARVFALDNPIVEEEWNLARFEIEGH